MIYVIHQRLKAQQADAGRTALILNDLCRSLFAEELSDALFPPQDIASVGSLFRLFGELAHSSIMRLSTSRCAACACAHVTDSAVLRTACSQIALDFLSR